MQQTEGLRVFYSVLFLYSLLRLFLKCWWLWESDGSSNLYCCVFHVQRNLNKLLVSIIRWNFTSCIVVLLNFYQFLFIRTLKNYWISRQELELIFLTQNNLIYTPPPFSSSIKKGTSSDVCVWVFSEIACIYISISAKVIWNRKMMCKYLRRCTLKGWKQCKWVSKNFAGYLKVILASDFSFVVRGNIIHDTELITKPDGPLGLFKLAVVGQTPASSHESKQSGRNFSVSQSIFQFNNW